MRLTPSTAPAPAHGSGPARVGGPPRGPDRQRGSMAVEFVLLAPLMIALILFLVLCGRVLEAHGQVDGAARDAARAASIARSSAQAAANATAAASADLSGWCVSGAVASVTGFAPASTQVVVQVTCTLDLQPISFGTVQVTGFAAAPLDSFVARS